MTTNVKSGNSCQFVAEFVDSNGNITIPAGATLSITYSISSVLNTTNITMALNNSFYTATWASSVSDLGPATWAITASGGSSSTVSGNLRIITP